MLTSLLVAHASAQPVRSPRLNAEAVLLLDADGRTIFEKNADVERAPASLVKRMNTKGKEFGMAATRFANPHGLPDPLQRTSAKDMALLIARLLHDYPAARTLLGGQTFIYRGRVYARHIPLFDDPLGVQALKTGFTHEAGYNLAAAARRGGQEFVMIVLGSRRRAQSFLDAQP